MAQENVTGFPRLAKVQTEPVAVRLVRFEKMFLALGVDVDEDIRNAWRICFGPIVLERMEVVEIGHIALDLDGFAVGLTREKTNPPEACLGSERRAVLLEVEFGFGHGGKNTLLGPSTVNA
jgi:hypothetical protein